MAMINNTLAAQVPTFDSATPLAQAAKLQMADQEIRQAQFKQMQTEIGSEARGLTAFVNTPEFPARWAETADRMLAKGLMDPQTHQKWRNTPSPLLLKQMITQTEDPTLTFRKEEAGRDQSNNDRDFKATQGYRAQTLALQRENQDYSPDERAAQAEKYGLRPGTPEYQQYTLNGELPTRAAVQPTELERRAVAGGLQPGTKEFQDFVIRGGRNADVAPSITEKKEIFKSEDAVPALDATISNIKRAMELNPDVYEGYGASTRGSLGARLPAGMVDYIPGIDRTKGKATAEWDQLMSQEAIKQMSETLKGASTDFEMKKFLGIAADTSLPSETRKNAMERFLSLAEAEREIRLRRSKELRTGDYFKPGGEKSKDKPPASDRFSQIMKENGGNKAAAYKKLQEEGY